MQSGPIVVVTWPRFDPAASPGSEALRAEGLEVRLAPKTGARRPSEVIELATGAMGAVVSTDPFDAAVLGSLPELRVIARVGVGTDSIDLAAATAAGVLVTTTPGANEEVVADHTLALLLAVIRRVTEHDASMRAGSWDRVGSLTAGHLHGRTVGIVGYGSIGRAVAARLGGFGVRILVHDPFVASGSGDAFVGLDELLSRSDTVTVHVPLDTSTRGLIGARELALLPAGAVIVNTARGGIIDEEALVDALTSGRLGGAGLDVFSAEPPTGSPLLALPQVTLSPHIAGLSHGSIAEMSRRACESVAAVARGEVPASAVNPGAAEAWR